MKTVMVAGATVTVPSFVDVASGETTSGNVEVTATTTQPSGTSVSIRVYEDADMDNQPDTQQEETIPAGTDEVVEYAALDGVEGGGYQYWLDVNLSTTDDSETPEVDSVTITLPDQTQTPQEPGPDPIAGPDNPNSIGELWNNYRAFVAAVILAFAGIGMWSKSLAVGAFLAYVVFAYIAVVTQTVLFENILYVTLVLTFVGFAFKLWRLEFGGE